MQQPVQPGGYWDWNPKSIKAADLTPASQCEATWHGSDGVKVSRLVAYGIVFLAVAKTGVSFPELTDYQAVLSNDEDQLTVAMRPQLGRSLSSVMTFGNDPHALLPKLFNRGFTLSVAGASAGTVLQETVPATPLMGQLGFGVCVNMLLDAVHRHFAKP